MVCGEPEVELMVTVPAPPPTLIKSQFVPATPATLSSSQLYPLPASRVSEETESVPGLLPGAMRPPDWIVTAPSEPLPPKTALFPTVVAVLVLVPLKTRPPPLRVVAPL